MSGEHRSIDPRLIAEARRQGEGWVYEIDGDFSPDDFVPPQAIVGAWQVQAGEIVGEFQPNPNYVKGSKWRGIAAE